MTDLSLIEELTRLSPYGLILLLIMLLYKRVLVWWHEVEREREERAREQLEHDALVKQLYAQLEEERRQAAMRFDTMVREKDAHREEDAKMWQAQLDYVNRQLDKWEKLARDGTFLAKESLALAEKREG